MKKLWCLLPILIVGMLLLIPIPRPFEAEYSCTATDPYDPDFSQRHTVTVAGTYYDSLLLADSFTGRIDIPSLAYLDENTEPLELKIRLNTPEPVVCRVEGSLGYIEKENRIGYLWADEDLARFILSCTLPAGENTPGAYSTGDGWKREVFLTWPSMTAEEIAPIVYPKLFEN